MNTELARYDSACRALAEAVSAHKVMTVRKDAQALQHYAHIAGDRKLEADAAELRICAERRLGEMMAAQPKNEGGRPKTGFSDNPVSDDQPITLAKAGINKNLANRARKLAALPEDEFTIAVNELRIAIMSRTSKVISDLVKPPANARDKKKPVPPLDSASWHKATPEQRKAFVQAIRPSQFVAAVSVRTFWLGLTSDQRREIIGSVKPSDLIDAIDVSEFWNGLMPEQQLRFKELGMQKIAEAA